jgi:hypothetical protein
MTKSLNQRTQRKVFRRIALVESIRSVTGVDLSIEASRYFETYDKWVSSEGPAHALKRARAIHHTVTNYILEQPETAYPFLATKSGWPRACYGLRKYATSNPGFQAILSLTGFVRGEFAPGDPDFSTIEESGPSIQLDLLEEISSKAKAFERDLILEEPALGYRGKNGPNGPATFTSINEAKALMSDHKEYMEKLLDFSYTLYGEDFSSWIEEIIQETSKLPSFINPHRQRLRALAIKRELGGKDRIFAMADYWTQTILEPLHTYLNEILRTISQDGTFNQDKTAERAKHLTTTSKSLWSLDLTAATDRMPITLQSKVMSVISSNEYVSNIWSHLMVSLPFSYKNNNYYYSVGQGMGTYTSWPIMALTHHCIVRTAFDRCNDDSYDYVILGDDIIIAGDSPAREYQQILSELGMKISISKSVIGNNRAEIAKRIFIRGEEITPLPVRLINRLNRVNYTLFPQFIDWWKSRSGISLAQSVLDGSLERLSRKLFGKASDDALSLITSPIVYERYGIWSDRLHPLPDTCPGDVLELYSKFIREHMFQKVMEQMLDAQERSQREVDTFRERVRGVLDKAGFQQPTSPVGTKVLDVILGQFPLDVETVQGSTIVPLRISSFSSKTPFREEIVRRTNSALARFSREWRAGAYLKKFESFIKRNASIDVR